MNDKTLIWIDDRDDKMEQVANGAFMHLWKEGIMNFTVFFGDCFGNISDTNVEFYNINVKNLFSDFYRHCINPDNQESINEFKDLYDLYEQLKPDESIPKFTLRLPNDGKEHREKIQKLIDLWKNDPPSLKEWINKKALADKYSVECIFNAISDYDKVSYALDLVLLEGDLDKLNCNQEDCKPVISMELYRFITKTLKRKCVIYSQYTSLNKLQNNWKYLYSKHYDDTRIEDIDIIVRDGLYKGSINEEAIKKIKRLFK